MADDENVVHFPRGFKGKVPQTVEEVRNCVDNIAIFHVDECLGPILSMMVDTMENAGFDISGNEDRCTKDMAMVLTAVRSMLLKTRNVPHPFQEVAEETFELHDDGDVTFSATGHSVIPDAYYEHELGE